MTIIDALINFRFDWFPSRPVAGVNTDAMKLRSLLCRKYKFHSPYYKYGDVVNYAIKHPNGSWTGRNSPEHLGYHCRCCEEFLGWEYPYKTKSWLPEWNRARS